MPHEKYACQYGFVEMPDEDPGNIKRFIIDRIFLIFNREPS